MIETKMATAKMSPKLGQARPEGAFRQKVYNLVQNKNFDIFIALTIATSTAVICIKWPTMDNNVKLGV